MLFGSASYLASLEVVVFCISKEKSMNVGGGGWIWLHRNGLSSFQLVFTFYSPSQALSSLHTLLSLSPPSKPSMGTLYCQMSHGVSELVHTHYTALATAKHWLIIFTLLEFAGTGVSSGSTPSPSDRRPVSPSMSSRDESCDANQQPNWSTRSVRSELLWRPEVDPMHFEVVNFDNCFDPVDGLPLPVHEPQVSRSH